MSGQRERWPEVAIVAVAMTLVIGFVIWVLGSTAAQMIDYRIAPGRYLRAILMAAPAGVALAAAGWWFGRLPLLGRCAYAGNLAYIGIVKVLGFALAPWIGLVAALVAAVMLRAPVRVTGMLVLLPAMAAIAALYIALATTRYLSVPVLAF